MNRRRFLNLIGAAVIGTVLPLRHLSPSTQVGFDELVKATLMMRPAMSDHLFKSSPFLAHLRMNGVIEVAGTRNI